MIRFQPPTTGHYDRLPVAYMTAVVATTGELVLCSLFFPEQLAIAFPIAQAIGDLVDPPATMVNAAGDYVASYIVSRFNDGKDWLQKKLKADAKVGAEK